MTEASVSVTECLKRFLYTSTANPKYVTGDAEARKCYLKENLKLLDKIVQSADRQLLLDVVETVNGEDLLARRETIFVALAFAATSNLTEPDLKIGEANTFRNKVYKTLLTVCRNDRDYFTFVKFYSKWRKNFSSGMNKATFAYYSRKDPMMLAKDVARQKRYHGWSHKDVIKLAHGKTDSALTNLVINYILFDLKRAKEFGANVADGAAILAFLEEAQDLRRCENMAEIPRLISTVQATLIHVPSYHHKKIIVWEAILPYLDLKFVIQKLPLLYKYGFLRPDTPLHNRIVAALNNGTAVRASHIHPVEVFIGLRNFEKGGKPMDPRLAKHLRSKEGPATDVHEEERKREEEKKKKVPQKSAAIITALNKTLQLSYGNIVPMGLQFFIAIEVSERMEKRCLKTKNLTCLEAAVSVALSILKTEREVVIAVFNNHAMSLVTPIDKNITFGQLMTKCKQVQNGFVYIPAVFEQAAKRKQRPIDVFVNFVHYNHSLELVPKEMKKEKPIPALYKYRKNKKIPDARMITVSLASPNLSLADGSPHILDICGFDKDVPKVIEAFAKRYFQ